MKKPLIGSVTGARSTIRLSLVAKLDMPARRAVPVAEPAARDVAAADRELVAAVAQGGEHARQQRLVVLQVAVHGGDAGARLAWAPSMKAEDRPRRPIRCSSRTRGSRAPIAATAARVASVEVVVDENRLPANAVQDGIQPRDEAGDVAFLVQHRDDDAQRHAAASRGERARRALRRRPGRRGWAGHAEIRGVMAGDDESASLARAHATVRTAAHSAVRTAGARRARVLQSAIAGYLLSQSSSDRYGGWP